MSQAKGSEGKKAAVFCLRDLQAEKSQWKQLLPIYSSSSVDFLLWVSSSGLNKNHRIIESPRLEKTSKISKSNHQPNTPMPAKPCPELPYLRVF